jgi:hypothetical protein
MLNPSRTHLTSTLAILALTLATLCEGAMHTGTAGGPGGSPFADRPPAPDALIAAVMVRSGNWIDAVQILYQTPDGNRTPSAPHGGTGGGPGVFALEPDERITAISGRHGHYVHSIRIHTNKRVSREYGTATGAPYRIDVPPGRTMVGFVGRSGVYLDAIGIAFGAPRFSPDYSGGAGSSGPPSSNMPSASSSSSAPAQPSSPRLLMAPRVESSIQDDKRHARVTVTVDLSAPAAVELVLGHDDPGSGRCYPPGYRHVLRSSSPTPSTRHTLGMQNMPMAAPFFYAIRIGSGRCESGRFTTATLID